MSTVKKKSSSASGFGAVMKRLRKNKLAMVGLLIIIVLLICVVFADVLAPYSYEEMDTAHAYSWPTKEHICGTDALGRDIFSRLIYGTRYSLQIGVLSVAIAASIGLVLGSISGYYGGKIDMVIMRFLDIYQSVPGILLSIAFAAALGPGITNATIAIGISTIASHARMIRASIMTVRDSEYVDAAGLINASTGRIIVKHILPNAISPLIVSVTMSIGSSILAAATLSFIGLGSQPPAPEWGAMLSAGRSLMRDYGYLVIFPGIAIMITVLSFNLLGDGLRDALDPRLKN